VTIGELPPRKGSEARLLRGYGPLLGLVVAFLVMALLAPTVAPEQRVGATASSGGSSGSRSTTATTAPGAGGATASTAAGGAAPGAGGAPAGAAACQGPQVQNDPYSPPCLTWGGGDNGGATSNGVTADTINVALRDPGPPYDIGSVVGQLTGKNPTGVATTRDSYLRTYTTLMEYFNKHFQFYGRKLKLSVYRGKGSLFDEILGGGQANANADAIQAAQQLHAFADLSTEAPVFADALQKQGVMVTNPIYPSNKWFADRQPYAFGILPDCSKIIDYGVDFVLKELAGKPVIAGEFAGKPRKIALIYPQAPIYQECGDQARKELAAAGYPVADYKLYTLSLEGIPNDAGPIASQFANEGITTVVLGTDPLMPYFLTTNATQSGWFPEWINVGVAYMDADWAGQLYDAAQWKNSFGVSLTGTQQPARATYGYAAYQSVDPSTSPDPLLVEAIYYQLYSLAIGVQMAGPDLTPATYAAGMHRYRGVATGPQGTWAFPPGDFTAPQDARIIWWDPNLTSVYNGAKGAYRDTGQRFPVGHFPAGPPPVHLTK
jgi:hypothetical protein